MYEIFYNFSAEPFRLSPDHRFCFEHKSYGKARAYMAYAFKRAEGFVMITGRPGTGKTTLIGELVEGLSREKVVTANLVCTQLQADDLLKTVAYNFGISQAEVGKAELLQRLNVLLHRWHREGRRALLVVDEAQDLSSSAMEELRLLTNIQIGGQPLLQIFLLGQPELRDLILSPEMEQVHQRIVAASHIQGLEEDETEAYVLHRLTAVGWNGDPAIDRGIFPFIHRFSEGVPRRINLICSRLFLLGSVEERHTIEVADVRIVISELQAENLAAGTGLSQQDLSSKSTPDWVPVPEDHSPERAVPQLQAVENASYVAAGEAVDQITEAKKKDLPSFEQVADSAVDDVLDTPETPTAQFEAVPEADARNALPSESEKAPHVALIAPDTAEAPEVAPASKAESTTEERVDTPPETAQALPSGDRETSSFASNSVVVAPPTALKRFILMALLTLLVLALIVFLKSFLVTTESVSHDESGQPKALSETSRIREVDGLGGPAVEAKASANVGPGLPQRKGYTEQDRSPAMAANDAILDERQVLAPIFVDGNLRRPIPVLAVHPVSPNDLPLDTDRSDSKEASAANAVLADGPKAVAIQSDQGKAWQETILISFSFDSDDLIPDAYLALDRAVAMLRENIKTVASITGFTDNRGDSRYNLTLSRKRAGAVEQYLVDAGVARERLRVEGLGVLSNPIGGQISDVDDPLEPFRVVQIKLSREG